MVNHLTDWHYPALFLANFLLIMGDAAAGYYGAPVLSSIGLDEQAEREGRVSTIRAMLSLVVAVYMFFNCLAYFRRSEIYLLVLTAVVLVDLATQIYIYRRYKDPD